MELSTLMTTDVNVAYLAPSANGPLHLYVAFSDRYRRNTDSFHYNFAYFCAGN